MLVIMNNVLQVLYEKPYNGSAWVIGPISKIINLINNPQIEIISRGSVVGKVNVKNKIIV